MGKPIELIDGKLRLNVEMSMTATANDTANIRVYGEIANSKWWGDETTPQDVLHELEKNGTPNFINVYINSPGGSAFAGVAIYNVLKSHPAKVNVFVEGLAASAASIVAMAGDHIVMGNGAMMMIHNPLVGMMGYYQADELLELAAWLEKLAESFAPIYADRTGKELDEIHQLLDAETWMTAVEAVEMGFANETTFKMQMVACTAGDKVAINGVEMDISSFLKAPELLWKAPDKREEVEKMDFEMLQTNHPELFQEVLNMGASQERTRIQAIEQLATAETAEMATNAKFGEARLSVEQFALSVVVKQKDLATARLSALELDGQELINKAPETDGTVKSKSDEADEKLIQAAIDGANRKRG